MGNEQSPCCCPENGPGHDKSAKKRKISVEDTDWAQAINDGDINEVKSLLSSNKHLLNEVVNNSAGYNGLHLCVINKEYRILEYLLRNNPLIDTPDKLNGNTPLHEACKFNDLRALMLLLQYGADTKITNSAGKTPIRLATDQQVKQALKNHKFKSKSSYNQIEQSRSVSNGSQSINSQTRSYSNEVRDSYSYTQRIEEIPSPQSTMRYEKPRGESSVSHQLTRKGTMKSSDPKTWFYKKMGVELEQVADFMRRLPNRSKMWDAFIGAEKKEITEENKSKDLFRLVFGTIYACSKKLDRSAPQPSRTVAKKIMNRIVELLADEQNKVSNSLSPQSMKLTYVLPKEKFVNEFHGYLYQCADDIRSGLIKEI